MHRYRPASAVTGAGCPAGSRAAAPAMRRGQGRLWPRPAPVRLHPMTRATGVKFLETRPEAGEYLPYYGTYIARVPAGDVAEILDAQQASTQRLLAPLGEARARHRYAPDKWSVKEVIGHLADAERVFAYRALRFARADESPLTGFDEKAYVPVADFDRRTLTSLLAEFAAVRAATLVLLTSLDEAAWLRRGTANGAGVSVRALACIIAGHELHHVAILRERYGVGG
jgi:hypothetical protein